MNTQVIEKIPTPEYLLPYWDVKEVTRVVITPTRPTHKIIAPANKRSVGLDLQNAGRSQDGSITYYFKGTGTQGYQIIDNQTVIHEEIITVV